MAARSNACSEITRFWLEARHGYLVTEGLPVPVPFGLSDIDLLAMHPRNTTLALPNGTLIGPRVIIETKDEHDFDPRGREFGKYLRSDVDKLSQDGFIPVGARDVKFSMLREQHFRRAIEMFGCDDFDRLFVVHAMDPTVLAEFEASFVPLRIHWMTIRELVRDLRDWYRLHPRPAGLRHTLVGDLWHLMVGYSGLDLPLN
jgi:hypothetical protein